MAPRASVGLVVAALACVLLLRAQPRTQAVVPMRVSAAHNSLSTFPAHALPPLPLRASAEAAAATVRSPFDLDSAEGIDGALRATGVDNTSREVILFTSDWTGIVPAVNLVQQLSAWSLDARMLLLADVERTCSRTARAWPLIRIACGWSRGIPGFRERYGSTYGSVVGLWTLWSAKWLVLARLVERRANVLMLDSDMMVSTNPYPLLDCWPLRRFALLVPPEGARVNVGWIYARGALSRTGGLPSVLWDMVRRLRLFLEQMLSPTQAPTPTLTEP